MQNYINLNQPQMLGYGVTLQEGIILDYILKANNWAKTIQDEEGRTYFQVNAGKILDDLPILGIKTKKGILDKIKKLVHIGLLDRFNQLSPFYAPTELTKSYYFTGQKPNEMVTGVLPNGNTTITKWLDNSNINNNIKYITISVDQVKEKNKTLAKEVETLLFSLQGETDLKDVGHIDIINLWNSYSEEYKLPKVNTNNLETVMIKQIKRFWDTFKIKYSKEEFNVGLQNYLKNIKSRRPDGQANGYYNHRFTLAQFLKQQNGIIKFMAEG